MEVVDTAPRSVHYVSFASGFGATAVWEIENFQGICVISAPVCADGAGEQTL